jgi:hypothetical protein
MKLNYKIKWFILIGYCSLAFLFSPFKTQSQEINPLPFVANWEDGLNNYLQGYNTEWQIENIEKGHHILLHFGYDVMFSDWVFDDYGESYFINPIEKAASYGIPITIETTQPEALLYSSGGPWRGLPSAENPNIVESDGTVHGTISPCGPIAPWRTVGEGWVNPSVLVDAGFRYRDWYSNPMIYQLQNLYPDPPFVIWMSNNEASDADYDNIDLDYRFQDAYSGDPDYDSWQFRNEVIGGETNLTNPGAGGYETGHGYIPRYNAMFEGIRDQLNEWSDKVRFVGYHSGSRCFGRWDGWVKYIPAPIPGRFSTVPFIWDGLSPAYYVNEWQGNWDFTGYAPQLEAMNFPFQKKYYENVYGNPDFDFWWELSTWFDPKFIEKFEGQGQEVPPERYEGYIKWGMWLSRPKAVRDFKYSTQTRQETWEWYEVVVNAVDEVHLNPTLERFWKYSEPLLLTDIPHPWQYNDEFWPALFYNNDERMRWYQLPNNLTYTPNSGDNWSSVHGRTYEVWIMANIMGSAPNREWLIYAHATLDAEVYVEAEIPGYGTINLTVKREGTYYLVREAGSDEYITTEPSVRAVELDNIGLNTGELHRFNGIYSTAYKCNITD